MDKVFSNPVCSLGLFSALRQKPQHSGEERGGRNGCGQREFLKHLAGGSCLHPAQDWAMAAAASR